MLVLDSGAVTRLAERSTRVAFLLRGLRAQGWWPPVVPTAVLVESLTGEGPRDARVNQLLKSCLVVNVLPLETARRAAHLRARAGRGSAIDAIVVAIAEGGGRVLTGDVADLRALAAHADRVAVDAV